MSQATGSEDAQSLPRAPRFPRAASRTCLRAPTRDKAYISAASASVAASLVAAAAAAVAARGSGLVQPSLGSRARPERCLGGAPPRGGRSADCSRAIVSGRPSGIMNGPRSGARRPGSGGGSAIAGGGGGGDGSGQNSVGPEGPAVRDPWVTARCWGLAEASKRGAGVHLGARRRADCTALREA